MDHWESPPLVAVAVSSMPVSRPLLLPDEAHHEETPLLKKTYKELEDKSKPTPLPRLQIAIVLMVQFCEPITSQCIYPFINQLIRELNVSERKVGYFAGVIQSVFFVTEAITVLQWSRSSDYIGRKPVILIGLSGLCLSMLSFGLSRTFLQLVISRCLAGMLNGNVGVMKSMIAEITDDTNCAQGFAFIPIMWSVGAATGSYIGAEIWRKYPYLLPCSASAVIIAITFLAAAIFLKESLPRLSSKKVDFSETTGDEPSLVHTLSDSEQPVPLRKLLAFPFLIIILNYVLLSILSIMAAALQPLFYSTPIEYGGLGLTPFSIGRWIGTAGLCNGAFQAFFFARIVRRWGPNTIFITGMVAFLPLYALFPVINLVARRSGLSLSVWLLMACQTICQLLWDMSYASMYMIIASAAPNKRSLGAMNGFAQTAVSIARAVGPVTATSMFAFSSEHHLLGGNGVYLIMFLLACLSLATSFHMPRNS